MRFLFEQQEIPVAEKMGRRQSTDAAAYDDDIVRAETGGRLKTFPSRTW